MAKFGEVDTERVLDRSVVLTIDDFRLGAMGPTNVTVGTTPTVAGLRFDAVGELLSVEVIMPRDWDRTGNAILHLNWALNEVESDGDSLDITVDYIVGRDFSTGSGPTKPSTQLLISRAVTTAEGLALNDLYSTEAVLDANDANNPFTDGSIFIFEFHLTNVIGVSEAVFLGGCVHYEALY